MYVCIPTYEFTGAAKIVISVNEGSTANTYLIPVKTNNTMMIKLITYIKKENKSVKTSDWVFVVS